MMTKASKTTSLPGGFQERSPEWHLKHFIEFTKLKMAIGEPSPHLAIVGHMARDCSMGKRLWLLGCYAATYCLPTAQLLWEQWSPRRLAKHPEEFERWLGENWAGIVTRQERRCVRTPRKMADCLQSYVRWMQEEFPRLQQAAQGIEDPNEYYDLVWESVSGIRFFGRYINIRLVEGLRRYCGIPASLYDIRSIGGWSPKKALAYLYPEHAPVLLVDDAAGNRLTNKLARQLLRRVRDDLPKVDEYILAAMLCEYKGAFEKRHQYPGWTIDQEPLLYDKVFAYWGDVIDRNMLWEARQALFPASVLGEAGGWNGTRWDCAATLRDHGYNWSDQRYDYLKTMASGDFSRPVPKQGLLTKVGNGRK